MNPIWMRILVKATGRVIEAPDHCVYDLGEFIIYSTLKKGDVDDGSFVYETFRSNDVVLETFMKGGL